MRHNDEKKSQGNKSDFYSIGVFLAEHLFSNISFWITVNWTIRPFNICNFFFSRIEVFGPVLKNYAKFTGKHRCLSLVFIKL